MAAAAVKRADPWPLVQQFALTLTACPESLFRERMLTVARPESVEGSNAIE